MVRSLALAIPLFLLVPHSDDAIRKEKEKLQGVWKMEAVTINGVAVTDDVLKTSQLEIKGNVGTVTFNDGMLQWQFKLDPTLNPKTIDLKSLMGEDKDQVYPGIYTLEENRFVLCRTFSPGNGRPDGFSAEPDSLCVLVIYTREKAKE